MKKMAVATVLAVAAFQLAGEPFADTYVAAHGRSSPERIYNNSGAERPNVNPHPGLRGTRSPTSINQAKRSDTLGGPSFDQHRQRLH